MKKSTEEVVSMFLGLVVVVVAVGLIFTYFQRKRGEITVPGVSETINKPTETVVKNESGEIIYTVKKSDSLWKIAEVNYGSGYNWVDISKSNKLRNPEKLLVGQKLILPKAEKRLITTTTSKQNLNKIEIGTYKVVKGDSLWKIAVRAYGDGYQWVQIWKSNKTKFRDPNKLEIGMELILPKLN